MRQVNLNKKLSIFLLDAFLWRILWGVWTVLSSQQRMDEGGGSLLILVMTVMIMVTIMMVMMVIPVFSLVDVEWESVDQRLLNSWLQDLRVSGGEGQQSQEE